MKKYYHFLLIITCAPFVVNMSANKSLLKTDNPPKISVTFTSNCGFLVEIGDKKILFDLEDPSKSFLKNDLIKAYELLYANKAPFDNIDYLFISHEHPDHFGVKEVSKILQSNKKISLFTTSVVMDELKKFDPTVIDNLKNALVVNPFESGSTIIENEGIKIEFLGTYHAGAPNYVVPDLCFIITVEDVRIFYMSDIDPGYEKNYEIIKKWSAKNEKVDLLFAPDVVLYLNEWSSQRGIDAVKKLIKPAQIIATHFDPGNVEESAKKVSAKFGNVVYLKENLSKWKYSPSSTKYFND